MNLKPGDILICRGDRFISKLIMKATHSHWSHTALYVELWGQPSIIEAQSKGIFPKLFVDWKTDWKQECENQSTSYDSERGMYGCFERSFPKNQNHQFFRAKSLDLE